MLLCKTCTQAKCTAAACACHLGIVKQVVLGTSTQTTGAPVKDAEVWLHILKDPLKLRLLVGCALEDLTALLLQQLCVLIL